MVYRPLAISESYFLGSLAGMLVRLKLKNQFFLKLVLVPIRCTKLRSSEFFLKLVLVPIRCTKLEELITVSCAEAHVTGLHRWQVDGACFSLSYSGIKPNLPRQKAGTSMTRPSGRSEDGN